MQYTASLDTIPAAQSYEVRHGITSDSRVDCTLPGTDYRGTDYAAAVDAYFEARAELRPLLEREADCRGSVRRLGGDYAAVQLWAVSDGGDDLLSGDVYTAADLEEDRDREELEREARGLGSASPTPEGLADHWAA
jgi:hypothetical protein